MGDAGADPAALLDRGLRVLASGQEELALDFFKRSQTLDPSNVEVYKALGETYADLDRVDEAKAAFQAWSHLDPTDSSVCMYQAQLHQGHDALKFYEEGIKRMKTEFHGASEATEKARLRLLVCQALCSVTELFMTDLCFEPDAETRCAAFLEEALSHAPYNPEALQAFASFRASQSKPEQARQAAQRAFATVMEIMDRVQAQDEASAPEGAAAPALAASPSSSSDSSGAAGSVPDGGLSEAHRAAMLAELDVLADPEALLPTFEVRAAIARTLFELGETRSAVALLERLVEENDEIVEVWLLLGQCHVALGDGPAASECMDKAQELCERLVKFAPHLKSNEQFAAMVQQVSALSQVVKARVAKYDKA